MGGDYKNPESFVKEIVDAQNLDEYTTQIFDFYVFNVSCRFRSMDVMSISFRHTTVSHFLYPR